MKKNIVIVGVLDKKESTNVSMAKSFMRFGYKVLPVNYRTIIQNHGYPFFEQTLIETLKKYNPVLTIFCKCNGINSNIVLNCNRYSKTWLWNMDPIKTIEQCPEVIQHAKNANFSSCTGGGINEYFRQHGVSECYTIFDGLDYDTYLSTEPVDKYKADISFIGGRTSERDKFKWILEDLGLDVKFYGQGYTESVYNEEFAKVCGSSKMMLSLNTYNDIPDYFSNRLLRYLGCGVCVLHYDPTETLHKYFEPYKEIIFFKNEEELINIIGKIGVAVGKLTYLDVGKIALAGREKVLRNYTWDHTVNKILQIALG